MKKSILFVGLFTISLASIARGDALESLLKFNFNTVTAGVFGIALEMEEEKIVAEYAKRMAAMDKRYELASQQDYYLSLSQELLRYQASEASVRQSLNEFSAQVQADAEIQRRLQRWAVSFGSQSGNVGFAAELLQDANATIMSPSPFPVAQDMLLAQLRMKQASLLAESSAAELAAVDVRRLARESATASAEMLSLRARFVSQLQGYSDRIAVVKRMMKELKDKNVELAQNLPPLESKPD